MPGTSRPTNKPLGPTSGGHAAEEGDSIEVTPHTVGQFMMLWEVATACAGLMLDVDAYDQPAVELGKKATFALMGKPGFEELRGRLEG